MVLGNRADPVCHQANPYSHPEGLTDPISWGLAEQDFSPIGDVVPPVGRGLLREHQLALEYL